MKRLITSLSVFTLLTLSSVAYTQNYCVEPSGELLGTIHQLEAQGYTLTDIQCTQVNYLVEPTPPYVNRIINVTMREIQCPENDLMGMPCILLSTAHFTAEEIVQNEAGTTRQTNISQIIIAY